MAKLGESGACSPRRLLLVASETMMIICGGGGGGASQGDIPWFSSSK